MRNEPVLIVTCDGEACGGEEYEASLTALAGRCWDARGVDAELKRAGWTKDGSRDFCPECSDVDESED